MFAGRYRLIEQLGEGGYSEVWLVEDSKGSNIKVVLKVFAAGTGLDSDGLKVFANEYSIVFNLNHPHLLRPMHFDEWEGMPYLVMQYMTEGNCLKLCGKLNETEIGQFIYQLSSAVAYMHDQDPPIVHHDIKPDNVLRNDRKQFFLTDFGISTKIRKTLSNSLGVKSISSGTMAYMAPERFSKILDERKPIKANDIFSLGVTVFELMTDELPYGEQGGVHALAGFSPLELPDTFSEELRSLVMACIDKEPWNRPTASEIETAAKSFIHQGKWDLPERIKKKSKELDVVEEIEQKKSGRRTSPQMRVEHENEVKPFKEAEQKEKSEPSEKKIMIESPKKRKVLFWLLIPFLFIVLIVLLSQPWRNRDQEAWELALSGNSIESFTQYIEDFSDGDFVNIAKDSIAKKQERQDWTTTLQNNTISAYEDFMDEYPESQYFQTARDSVNMIHQRESLLAARESQAWAQATRLQTIESYEVYLKDYPNTSNSEKARNFISETKAKAEQFADEGDRYMQRGEYDKAVGSYNQSLQLIENEDVRKKRDQAQKKIPWTYYDGFGSARTWTDMSDESKKWKHDGGVLKGFSYNKEYSYSRNLSFDKFTNCKSFEISIYAKKVKGADNFDYGMLFASQSDNPSNRFSVSGNGQYYIGQYRDGKWDGKWTENSNVKGEGSWNKLKVVYDGSYFIYYLNGVQVSKKSATILGNSVGIYFSGSIEEVWFDDLDIKVTY